MTTKAFCVLIIAVLACGCSTYRFRSVESVRNSVLRTTPIGSPRATVQARLKKRWSREYEKWSHPAPGYAHLRQEDVIGPFYIGWHMVGLMETSGFVITWQFDTTHTLTNVVVRKEYDGP